MRVIEGKWWAMRRLYTKYVDEIAKKFDELERSIYSKKWFEARCELYKESDELWGDYT